MTKRRRDEDPELVRRRAAVLRFLVEAQRTRGVTLQSLAVEHETQRSNLSAYIRSEGQRRCIAYERLREVLFHLGMHWDFTLRGLLHRWDIGVDADLFAGLQTVLAGNEVSRVCMIPTAGHREAFIAFVVVETAGKAIGLIRVQRRLFGPVCRYFGLDSDLPVVDAAMSDAVQSAWMAKDSSLAATGVRELLTIRHSAIARPKRGRSGAKEQCAATA